MVTELVSTSKIAAFCANILKEYTLSKEVRISSDESDPCRYFLQGKGLVLKKGSHQQLLPTIILKNGYYLYFGITFQLVDISKPKTGFLIKGVSLQIFYKDSLLFRAEWDNKSEDETDHPQPHWHIEPIAAFDGKEISTEIKGFIDSLEQDPFDGFSTFLGAGDIQQRLNLKYEKFHFAMSSCWHEDETKCNIPLTEKNLLKWLRNCMSSIDSQLAYISK